MLSLWLVEYNVGIDLVKQNFYAFAMPGTFAIQFAKLTDKD
jgi:hypothetical protein